MLNDNRICSTTVERTIEELDQSRGGMDFAVHRGRPDHHEVPESSLTGGAIGAQPAYVIFPLISGENGLSKVYRRSRKVRENNRIVTGT